MKNLYHECSDLIITDDDKRFLENFKIQFSNLATSFKTKNPDGSDRVFEPYKNYFFRDCPQTFVEHPLFKKISTLLSKTPHHHDYKYIYSRAHLAIVTGSLPYHRDLRNCVLSIPLCKIETPLYWCNADYSLIEEYSYTGQPVLIDTATLHGSPENVTPRYFFQVGFNESYDTILNCLAT